MNIKENKITRTAGIKPPSAFDDSLLGALKQSVLLFDLVGIPSLDNSIEQFNAKHKPTNNQRYIINELEYLREQGYLFDAMYKGGTELRNDADIPSITREFKQLSDIIRKGNDSELAMEAAARLSCLLLNNEATNRDFFSLPLIKRLTLTDDISISKTDVINLVIEQMPIPNEQTPWERVLEYKSNPDNKGRFAGMRTWINKAVNSGLTAPEIRDELEYLLYQYQKSLELHKIKHQTGILQTLVVGTAEIVENLIKLKFSDIAKGLFSAQLSNAELLNAELTAPGNELAYIYKARQTFRK